MTITEAELERLGISQPPDVVERLLLDAMRQVMRGIRTVEPRSELVPGEVAALARGGLSFDLREADADDALLRTAAEYAALIATSLSVSQVAQMLEVDSSRIRQRLAARTIYGIKQRAGWRIPLFQFDRGRPLPGIDEVLPRLDPGLHPLAVLHWFTTPDIDLAHGDDETPLSPRDWLRLGLNPGTVAAITADL